MILKFIYCCVLFISASVLSDGARILAVFPVPSISHQVVFRPLTQELAKRGHEVIVITPDPAFPKGQSPENLTEIDLHDLSYNAWKELFLKNFNFGAGKSYDMLKIVFRSTVKVFELQIKTDEVQKILNSEQHFDLILLEACMRSALIFSHVFKAPVIQVSSLGAVPPNYQVIGAPSHPILYPELTRQRLYNLTFWEKINGIYEDIRFKYMLWTMEEVENKMLRDIFGKETPSVSELNNNVDMLFLNIHPIWDHNRPVPPGVIFMGGLHQKPVKELPSDLKSYLEQSKNGVIYMSFGTNVSPSNLPSDRIQLFNKVFTKLPYDVLWKWDRDTMPGKAHNVRITKWVPQADLLRHPKIKLFITQAGLQSTDEAISAGVPLIAFPMLGDQWYNAENYVRHNIGLKFEFNEITEDVLEESINKVIENQSFRGNIIKLGQLMSDQPQRPLDRAVWWAEHVIRHKGAKHYRAPAANLSWTEFLLLEVLWKLFMIILVICYAVYKIIFLLMSRTKKVKTN